MIRFALAGLELLHEFSPVLELLVLIVVLLIGCQNMCKAAKALLDQFSDISVGRFIVSWWIVIGYIIAKCYIVLALTVAVCYTAQQIM